ncbi:MAG: NfeD family protein [Actinomycetales bacterium]|nr:NfeD family protein [Actinomycetales bacterium]
MNAWVWWIVAAGVLAVAEVLTGGTLVLLMLAGGAAAGGLTAALGAPPALSVGVFALVSVALLGLVRPIARRHMRVNREARTNVAALVGAEALVLESVDGQDGRIKLAGEIWSARAYDGQSVFEPGTRVQVLQIEGATALVAW